MPDAVASEAAARLEEHNATLRRQLERSEDGRLKYRRASLNAYAALLRDDREMACTILAAVIGDET